MSLVNSRPGSATDLAENTISMGSWFKLNLGPVGEQKQQLHALGMQVDLKKLENNSDACIPQPGEIVFNTMRYRSQRLGYFQSSGGYIKLKIMFT